MSRLRAWQWELTLIVLIALAVAWAASLSPYYLNPDQIAYALQQSIAVVGLLTAGMMVIIVVGEIDISIPAIMAICNILFARMSDLGAPLGLALPVILLVATLAGAFNGALVVSFGLPSLAVTLGTMGAYRALALLFGGQEGYAGFDPSYVWLGSAAFFDFLLPASLLLLIVVFAIFAFLMHRTTYGRLVYVIGSNAEAARFSGVAVKPVKTVAFAIGGFMAGLASLVYIGQYQSARADNGSDILLLIVTAVVLGGVDIFGGRGRVIGAFLALLLLGTLRNGMGLANFPGPVQTLIIGLLLVGSVLASQSVLTLGARIRALKVRRSAPSGGPNPWEGRHEGA
jgi:rhamnose transport system permease protein